MTMRVTVPVCVLMMRMSGKAVSVLVRSLRKIATGTRFLLLLHSQIV